MLSALATPRPGGDTQLLVLNPASGMPTTILLGVSNTVWNGSPLPFALAGLGYPGCSLLTSTDVTVSLGTPANPWVTWSAPTAGLTAGATVHVQSVALDPASGGLAGLSNGLTLTVAAGEPPISIAMLPDTQKYSQFAGRAALFNAQTAWLAANASRVGFVTHVGDIVQSGAAVADEWLRADAAMSRLDGVLPYALAIGNHDYDVVGDKRQATAVLARFGPPRYAGRTWFGGATADGRNSWQRVTIDGQDWLHLAIEWRADDDVVGWALGVLEAHADVPVILSTHEYLGTGAPASWRTGGSTPDGSGDNSGRDLFGKLVEPCPQVVLVLCGHVIGSGRLVSSTVLGQPVVQILADYQGDPNGGNGFFRRMHFDRAGSVLAVRTFSPTYVPGVTAGPDRSVEPNENFDVSFDFDARRAWLGQHRIYRFRDGQRTSGGAPYRGTVDTFVGDGASGTWLPTVPNGLEPNVWTDGNGDHMQGLLRFDGLVGRAPGQIPRGSRVVAAALTLTTEGSNSLSATGATAYPMVRFWNESSTWQSLGNGIQVGVETRSTPAFDTAGRVGFKGTASFDVTAGVQAWVDGAPNLGWALLANGTDGWSFRSADWNGALTERPLLTVVVR